MKAIMIVLWLELILVATVTQASIKSQISNTLINDKNFGPDVTSETSVSSECICMNQCIDDSTCFGVSFKPNPDGGGICKKGTSDSFQEDLVDELGTTIYKLNKPSPPTKIAIGEILSNYNVKVSVRWDKPYYPNAKPNTLKYHLKFTGLDGNGGETIKTTNGWVSVFSISSNPGVLVTVEISVSNQVGESEAVTVKYTTSSRVPTAPVNLVAVFTATGIKLTWEAPTTNRGPILKYRIRSYCGFMVWSGEHFEEHFVEGSTFEYMIQVEGCSTCKVMVNAITSDGIGPSVQTTGDTLEDSTDNLVKTKAIEALLLKTAKTAAEAKNAFESICVSTNIDITLTEGQTVSSKPINTPCLRKKLNELLTSQKELLIPAYYPGGKEPLWHDGTEVVRKENKLKLYYLTKFDEGNFMKCNSKTCWAKKGEYFSEEHYLVCTISTN